MKENKLQTISQIKQQLEYALSLAGNPATQEHARIIIVACKYALHAEAIKIMRQRLKYADEEENPSILSSLQKESNRHAPQNLLPSLQGQTFVSKEES